MTRNRFSKLAVFITFALFLSCSTDEPDDETNNTPYPIYQEYNNTYIKTGTVHIIEYNVPYRLSGLEDAKIYNSPDDYPKISKQEYERLAKEGRAFPAGKMLFGDPADLSYTETIIEKYRNVEINTIQNNAFKVIGGF